MKFSSAFSKLWNLDGTTLMFVIYLIVGCFIMPFVFLLCVEIFKKCRYFLDRYHL